VPSIVLVIDDNPQNRALAEATLEDEGYAVELAATGEEGLRAFAAGRPDCVLLDVRMPGMDGFAVCAALRALPGGAETPIIFLTASRDVETFDRALRAGGDDFLPKPFRPAELLVRVAAAVKLRRTSAELQEHVRLVRQQRDDLMRLQLQKERLTDFLVHDLKNPVNTIDLQAQLLARDRELPERAREAAQRIRNEGRALARLIMNLLDISKSVEGGLAPSWRDVDLPALAAAVLDELQLRATAAGVLLAHDVSVPVVRADEDLLRRVLENLLDNAIRHAPAGSEVRLEAAAHVDAIELRVTDAGPGIPASAHEQIFERFVQLGDAAAATRAGRGLGLTFCKAALEAHGGEIWVEDASPGAAFCLRLPR
jgi:two-component system, sensor histidine kinase and response regulator